jgi:hypothetical protein
MRAASAGRDLAHSMARASHRARRAIDVGSEHERCIRDVAAGVAAPALAGYVVWFVNRIERLKGERAYFLSRDGQVLRELAERMAGALACSADLRYLYSSRRTWNLAAASADDLPEQAWLFGSFMRSNAADLCARLGLPLEDYRDLLEESGVSLDPTVRSGDSAQRAAMDRFLRQEVVRAAMGRRIEEMRSLTIDYLAQEGLDSGGAVLVDAGWTGRMVNSLARVLADAEMPVPPVLFWAHQPKGGIAEPGVDIAAYLYDTSREARPRWRVADIPFLIESFLMADHGIVSGYSREEGGRVVPVLDSADNPSAEAWGLGLYRQALTAFCDGLVEEDHWHGDVRPLVRSLLDAFWMAPTRLEARVWGSYVYDSDPTGSAARALARGFSPEEVRSSVAGERLERGDRAWLAGSLALTPAPLRSKLSAIPE